MLRDCFVWGKWLGLLGAVWCLPAQAGNDECLNAQGKSAWQAYEQGVVLLQDKSPAQAYPLFEQAAGQKHPMAQYNLGLMSERGDGTRQDYAAAMKWYQAAATASGVCQMVSPGAQLRIGQLYAGGLGVTKDYRQALAWYSKAAAQGDAGAENNIGNLYREGGYGLTKDERQAATWFRRGAEHGNPQAQSNLGMMYAFGRGGLAEDDQAAFSWFSKSARQGYPVAQHALGVMYYKGTGVTRDLKESRFWLTKAAEQGNPEAKKFLSKNF